MKRLALIAFLVVVVSGCAIAVTMPYCPISDSAWAKADSVPAICMTDTAGLHRRKP